MMYNIEVPDNYNSKLRTNQLYERNSEKFL